MGIISGTGSVLVNSSSVKVGFSTAAAGHVYGHLTNGFSVVKDQAVVSNAWSAAGTLKVPGGAVGGQEFGFIQVQQMLTLAFEYVGASAAAGSMRLTPAEKPAMSTKTALDSRTLCKPWTLGQPGRWALNTPNLTVNTGDHPLVKVPKKITNDLTGEVNLLRGITDKRQFWTALAMQEGDSFTYFKHFSWTLSYVATFKWSGGAVAVDSSASSDCKFGGVKAGAPIDTAQTGHSLSGILNNPTGFLAHDLMNNAIEHSIKFVQPHNRRDFRDRTCGGTITVPDDFVT